MRCGRPWLPAAGACLVGFVSLALAVTSSVPLAALDVKVRHTVLALRAPALTDVMQTGTVVATLPVVVGTTVVGVLILVRRTRGWRGPVVLTSAVGVSALGIAVVKLLVGRARPPSGELLGPPALDHAFPSGHTGNGSLALCLTTGLICLTLPRTVARRLALAAAVAVSAGVGLTRVYLGYHWPSDVVGGWLLAVTTGSAAMHVTLRSQQARPTGRRPTCAAEGRRR